MLDVRWSWPAILYRYLLFLCMSLLFTNLTLEVLVQRRLRASEFIIISISVLVEQQFLKIGALPMRP